MRVPSSLSVISIPFAELLEKHFSQPQNSEKSIEHQSGSDVEHQQFSHNDQNLSKEDTLTARKVIVDLSGELSLPETDTNVGQRVEDSPAEKMTKMKPQTSSNPSVQSVRQKFMHNQKSMKVQNNPCTSRMISLSRLPGQAERFQTSDRESSSSSYSHNIQRSSHHYSSQRNSRSIILKRRGFDLHCFVCHQVLETYRQVGEHCRLHNLRQQCPVCKAKFSATSNMKRHCLGHFSHAFYPCSFCKATFRRKDNLRTHMLRHLQRGNKSKNAESKGDKSNCPEVANPSDDGDAADKVVAEQFCEIVENMESSDPGPQEYAGVVSMSVKQEKASEDEKEINETPAENMQEESSNPIDVDQDIEDGNPIEEGRIVSYNCSSCGLKFSDVQSIRKHVIRHHAEQINPGTNEEEEVNMYLPLSQSELYQAPEVEHALADDHSLSLVPDTAADNDLAMASNRILFSNQGYNLSDVIDIENLSQMSNSDVSQSTVTSEQASCAGMNSLSEPASLNMPTSSGHPKRGVLGSTALICSICQQYLQSGDSIMEHQTLHTNVMGRALWCVVCGTRFSSKDCLRRHVYNHMGTRFKCPMCSSVYSRKDNLKKHVKDVHHYHYDKNGSIRPLVQFQE